MPETKRCLWNPTPKLKGRGCRKKDIKLCMLFPVRCTGKSLSTVSGNHSLFSFLTMPWQEKFLKSIPPEHIWPIPTCICHSHFHPWKSQRRMAIHFLERERCHRHGRKCDRRKGTASKIQCILKCTSITGFKLSDPKEI